MTATVAAGGGKSAGGGARRNGADGPGARVAQAGAAGGVILFKRNIADAQQTRALLDEATGLCARESCALRGCGRRNGEPAARCAGADCRRRRRWRAAMRAAKKPALARKHGELIARAVKAFGFNTTLAPVVDLALPESAEVLGTRTAGANAAEVIAVCAGVSGWACGAGSGRMRKAFSGAGRRDGRHAFCDAGDSAHLDADLG